MTSLLEDGLDNAPEFWYDRAVSFYSAYHGNRVEYERQSRFWLDDYDYTLAMMAWSVVESEHRED